MKQFIEFVPIAVFVGVYFYTKDIFMSTGVLMAAMFIQVVYEFATTQKVSKKTLTIFGIVMVLGTLTLVFQDKTFLLWKPTIVNWIFSLGLLGNLFIGKQNLLAKLLGEQLTLPGHVWRNLSIGWGVGFFVAGVVNLFVAYQFSLDVWVSYKLIGGFAISLSYMIITMVYLTKGGYLNINETSDKI